MHNKTARSLVLAASAFGLLLATAGCGQASVDREEVASQISTQLEQQIGQRPDSVTCPEDLPAEEGASTRCELTAGGQTLGVTATVTSVEGGTARFDIRVDELPQG